MDFTKFTPQAMRALDTYAPEYARMLATDASVRRDVGAVEAFLGLMKGQEGEYKSSIERVLDAADFGHVTLNMLYRAADHNKLHAVNDRPDADGYLPNVHKAIKQAVRQASKRGPKGLVTRPHLAAELLETNDALLMRVLNIVGLDESARLRLKQILLNGNGVLDRKD